MSVRCDDCNRSLSVHDILRSKSSSSSSAAWCALEALHVAKHGHTRFLIDTDKLMASIDATQAKCRASTAACRDLDEKWQHFQDTFDKAIRKSVEAIGQALQKNPNALGPGLRLRTAAKHPEALPEEGDDDGDDEEEDNTLPEGERRAVLGLSVGERPSIEAVADGIRSGRFRKIVVLAGAGISVAAGIPDFRTPETGLYASLARFKLPQPEMMFDIDYFNKNPLPFFTLAKELYPGRFRPTATHCFVKLLERRGLLLRHYTQNVDCLERLAGLGASRVVECHGSFASCSCVTCGKKWPQSKVRRAISNEPLVIPTCDDDECGGVVKPDITFFGESLPSRFAEMHRGDLANCDLLLVMGTSLRVVPVCLMPGQVALTVPRVLLNRERVGNFAFGETNNYRDVYVQGDADAGTARLAALLGWSEALEKEVAEVAGLSESAALERLDCPLPPVHEA